MKYIEYRSIADMNSAIIKNLFKFPHDVDLVLGIPRSGMLPANMLALYLNKPYTDIDSFLDGKIYGSGERGTYMEKLSFKKVLVVDDSISSGKALYKAKAKLKDVMYDCEFLYAVVYASSKGSKMVDIFCEIIDYQRIFQWNIFHHPVLIPQSCMDIDGVLCLNPPIDDDGEKYVNYIINATPYFIPTVKVDTLVTCRLEKYRKQTETWLQNNGIKYEKLVMLDMPNKEERVKWGKHGEFKGEIYKKSKNVLFIESSLEEAQEINRVSGKPVFCTENFQMINSHIYIKRGQVKIHKLLWNYTVKPFRKLIRPWMI